MPLQPLCVCRAAAVAKWRLQFLYAYALYAQEAITWARQVIEERETLILDTETTGLDDVD